MQQHPVLPPPRRTNAIRVRLLDVPGHLDDVSRALVVLVLAAPAVVVSRHDRHLHLRLVHGVVVAFDLPNRDKTGAAGVVFVVSGADVLGEALEEGP